MFRHVEVLEVFLWGNRVGALAQTSSGEVIFEYDESFLRRGLEISPFMLPFTKRKYFCSAFQIPRNAFSGLPGVFADSLPDSFGNRLVADWMRRQGVDVGEISPLDRLAYIGSRGMGALEYKPRISPFREDFGALDMRKVAEEARLALNSNLSLVKGDEALREIVRVGTSAGGAQAKAVVGWTRATDEFRVGDGDLPEAFEHWIIKFTPTALDDSGENEYRIARQAIAAGIEMSECCLHEVDGQMHFMTKRFDCEGNVRHHLQTYCALKHLPSCAPRSLLSYEGIFETIEELQLGYDSLSQMFRRMAFNVFNREMDDHTKNFSFLMKSDGKWELAPAYDLTGRHFSNAAPEMFDFSNCHALSVNGRFSSIRDEDMIALARRFCIGSAERILQEVRNSLTEDSSKC